MIKFVLLSTQRHGTTFLSNCIAEGNNKSQIYMGGELLRPTYTYRELTAITSLKEIKDVMELHKLSRTDKLQFFYKRFEILEKRVKQDKVNVVGFKIFPRHIAYKHGRIEGSILRDVITYIDKIIILDRHNLEFMYSLAHTWVTKEFTRVKADRVFLDSDHVQMLIGEVINKYYFFEDVRAIAAEQNKECLYLDYDELDTAKDKLNRFFEIELKDWILLQKNSYDYRRFLDDNPSIATFIDNNPVYFKRNSLQYSALSTINNQQYEYDI